MLAYLSSRPAVGARGSSPNMMLFIVSAHVAAVAVLISARTDLPKRSTESPIIVRTIQPEPPEPADPQARPDPAPRHGPAVTYQDPIVPLPTEPAVTADPLPPLPGPSVAGPTAGSDSGTAAAIIATPALLLTGAAELKPPYPASKLASGEEADLKLRLTIDGAGRVIAVEPIGRADSSFLAAARRHILAHWRYRPAMRGGQGITATLVVTLRFRLDD